MNQKAASLGLTWRGPARGFLPSKGRSVEEILEASRGDYRRTGDYHKAKREGVDIDLPDDKPFGILFFGDPHLGDDGCDLPYLAHCLGLVQETEGLHAINMGDLANFWIGRLARLYSSQHTTDGEEIELAKWLLGKIPWLWVILGNHDVWTPVSEMLCRELKVPYARHGCKLRLRAPGGWSIKVDVRHSHKGHSQYTPNFAQAKQNYRGSDCEIIVGAHTHVSADTRIRNGVSGVLSTCVRVGAFKRYDEYADSGNFEDDNIGPAWMAVVDPSSSDVGRVQGFWDVDAGARYLAFLRGSTKGSGDSTICGGDRGGDQRKRGGTRRGRFEPA